MRKTLIHEMLYYMSAAEPGELNLADHKLNHKPFMLSNKKRHICELRWNMTNSLNFLPKHEAKWINL